MTTPRILVTGSRHWTDAAAIRRALLAVWTFPLLRHPETVLVHGACHLGGADILARDLWLSWGLRDEPHPAGRDSRGRLLGPARNQRMVDLGADVCLAFPLRGSRGTYDCIRRAEAAGIPVVTLDTLPGPIVG